MNETCLVRREAFKTLGLDFRGALLSSLCCHVLWFGQKNIRSLGALFTSLRNMKLSPHFLHNLEKRFFCLYSSYRGKYSFPSIEDNHTCHVFSMSFSAFFILFVKAISGCIIFCPRGPDTSIQQKVVSWYLRNTDRHKLDEGRMALAER